MGVGYYLINHSKGEYLVFSHVGASTARELAGNPIAASISTWYLLNHPGDRIAFVSDTYADWPFPDGSRDDLHDYPDVTDTVVTSMVQAGMLEDHGKSWADEDEPDTVYRRDLVNVWMSDGVRPLPDMNDNIYQLDAQYRTVGTSRPGEG